MLMQQFEVSFSNNSLNHLYQHNVRYCEGKEHITQINNTSKNIRYV